MIKKSKLNQIVTIFVAFTIVFSMIQPPTVYAQNDDNIKRQVNAQSGRVSFITPENGRVLSASKALGTFTRPQNPAFALASRYASEFGLESPVSDLTEMKSVRSEDGRVTARYQQVYQGIPVIGGELIVNTNDKGDLYSISGDVSPDLSLSTQPDVDSAQAVKTALQAIAKLYQKEIVDFVASEPELWIYDESLLRPSTRPAELVWRMEVTPIDKGIPVRELALVNAERGGVSLHFNQVDAAWGPGQDDAVAKQALDVAPVDPKYEGSLPIVDSESTSFSTEDMLELTGATWYVASTGDDANSCASPELPCFTVNGAINKAFDGDAVKIATGTYTGSTSPVVNITKSLEISGGWNDSFTFQEDMSTIDGTGNTHLVVMIRSNDQLNVILDRLVIQNGTYGIVNYETITIINSSIINNHTAGSYDDGAGINNTGNMTIINSTISGNIASGGGGGIYNKSTLNLNNSTVSGNLALSYGGGGVWNDYNGILKINNSTISNNTSNNGDAYSPLASGIRNNGTATTANSIIANNIRTGRPECSGSILQSLGHNLVRDGSNCPFSPTSGDKVGTSTQIIEPQLSSLQYHGGFTYTHTHALLTGSPAIDAGNPATCLPTDQRGLVRVDTCDIGAYEHIMSGAVASLAVADGNGQRVAPLHDFPKPLTVVALDNDRIPVPNIMITFTAPESGASGTFVDTGTHTISVLTNSVGVATTSTFSANHELGYYNVFASASGLSSVSFSLENGVWYVSSDGNDLNSCFVPTSPCLTINGAINKATSGGVIRVAEGTYGGAVTITKSINLSGGWNNEFDIQIGFSTIDGQDRWRGITVGNGSSVMIDHFIVKQGRAYQGGGIQVLNSTVSLDYMLIINNMSETTTGGGGIENQGTLTVDHSMIFGNKAGYGGGIYGSSASNTTINNSAVFSNIATFDGGGIYGGQFLTINNTTITKNISEGSGGGIYGSPILNNVTIMENHADNDGGGINGVATLKNSILANNTVGLADGRFPNCSSSITVDGHSIIYPPEDMCSYAGSGGYPLLVDPKLGAFIPLVGYYTIYPESPAINAGNPVTCLPTDQRGATRNDVCDIGAYEYIVPETAAYLFMSSGDGQRAAPTYAFSLPLTLVVLDSQHSPVPNVVVTFTAPASGASGTFVGTGTNAISMTTDGAGVATTTTFTSNNQSGAYPVSASANGLPSVIFNLENVAWYVSPSGNDSNSCSTPSSPCLTVNGAISKAVNGDTVFTAGGTYIGGAGNGPVVIINKSISLSGGWDDTFASRNGISIIDGQNIHSGVYVSSDISAMMEHFTIQNGINSSGGGVDIYGQLILNNSTVRNNSSIGSFGGGGINVVGTLIGQNITVVDNEATYNMKGGGIYIDLVATVILRNSIVANNAAAIDPDCSGRIDLSDHNIIGNKTGDCIITQVQGMGDIYNVNPELEAFIHGYYPFQIGSPALNSGNPTTCLSNDQRGVARPQGARCDIGAYEYVFNSDLNNMLITTYDMGNTSSLPGTFVCDQNDATCAVGDAHAMAAHTYATGTYDLYEDVHNRNSIDGNGIEIISSVHYASNYANAFWNGYMLIYGDGYGFPLADDIVAHEYTHGVTQYESNLFYYYQSGAINESFSDLWGEYYDQVNDHGNDSASLKWRIGEDIGGWTNPYVPECQTIPILGIRDMSNPTLFCDPDKMSSSNYYEGSADNGGVHWNSGVNNKAVYLLVEGSDDESGGKFNGKTISALGWEKTAAIYYEANTSLLTSGADYSDLYYALQQACTNLIGQHGITAGDCVEVKDAVDAVEMHGQPAANFNTDAPLCTVPGTGPNIFFADSLENGMSNWTFNNDGYTRWQYDSPYGPYAHSGTHHLYADDYPEAITDANARLNSIVVPNKAYLNFSHAYGFEWGVVNNLTYYFDGGVLEYSTNDGVIWIDAGSLIDYNGYDSKIYSHWNNPLNGQNAFVGDSHGYISTRLNLSTLAGKTVTFRWRMGLDDSTSWAGWWLDDIKIYTCISAFTISGNVNVPGVTLSYVDGTTKTVTSQMDGSYSLPVPPGWSGTVTPTHPCYTFDPPNLTYNSLPENISNQDYAAIPKPEMVCVLSITRAGPSPTDAASVEFTVTFSEPVTNVDVADFALTTGIADASITNVSDADPTYDATYTVTVDTGTGNGTLRLDVVDNGTILDEAGDPLGGDYTAGQVYTILKTTSFGDVPSDHPYFEYIEILYANGLTNGCNASPLLYCPSMSMNRAQIAKFFMTVQFGGSYLPPSNTPFLFQDNWNNNPWAQIWANDMLAKGLTSGCNASPLLYCPDVQIPREQVAKFALAIKHGNAYLPPPASGTLFADLTDANYWSTAWAEQAYLEGLVPACGTDLATGKPKFCPAGIVDRGFASFVIVTATGLLGP